MLAVKYLLRVAILYIDPEWFGCTMVALIPNEGGMGSQVQLDSNQSTSDWLHVSFELQTRELMDLIED